MSSLGAFLASWSRACALPLLCAATSTAQPAARPLTVTDLGTRYPISRRVSAEAEADRKTTVEHLTPATAPNAEVRYLRVYMELEKGAGGRWFLTVRDQDLRPVEVLTPESFLPGGGRWTTRVNGTRVYFDLDPLDAGPETKETRIALTEYIAMPVRAQSPYYSSQVPASPDYRDLYAGASGGKRRLGDTVGFVMGSYDQTSWCCSGVVVGQDLLLTNWHCGGKPGLTPQNDYWSPRSCQDTIVDLSWDGDSVSREFRCTDVLCQDLDLDFALLRMAPLGSGSAAKPAVVRRDPPVADEPLALIHHPECLPKRITDPCHVVDAAYRGWVDASAKVDFSHRCDTEEGSSGGAIFDERGRLVGLHHTGFAQSDDAVAKAGKFNTAVRMDRILAHLRSVGANSPACAVGLDKLLQVEP